MNKLDTELAQLKSELAYNTSEAEKFRADLAFFETFNVLETSKEILALVAVRNQKKELLDSSQNFSISSLSVGLGLFGGVFGNVLYEIWKKEADAKHKHYKDELAIEIGKLDAQITAGQSLIERHKSFDEHQLRAMIKTNKSREDILLGKIQIVMTRREKLLQAIGPLIESATQYRQQVRDYEEGIKACKAYLEKLAIYHDAPAKRRDVHEACA